MTPRSCTAKDPNVVTCGQPADNDLVCPDNTDSCVFTADPDGGTQGSCALTDWDTCQNALGIDNDGSLCTSLKCTYTPPPVDETVILVAPVVRICGDGKKASTEGCDDSNLADGDGCSASCQIEPGYVCPINYIQGTSVCKLPDIALVTLAPASRVISVEEGATVDLTIMRSGIERACTEQPLRSCTAKDPNTITCSQPADGETVCPDNTD
eukprot:COSAG02_NODE_22902_length_736_cov_1.194662_1_plen_210_part_01